MPSASLSVSTRTSRDEPTLRMSRPSSASSRLNSWLSFCSWPSGLSPSSIVRLAHFPPPLNTYVSSFTGNSRLPQFTQTNRVNIYLFHADSQQLVLSILNETNTFGRAGEISRQVNDLWFPERGLGFTGEPITYPYYWVITRADATLDGTEIPQATFSAVRELLFLPL